MSEVARIAEALREATRTQGEPGGRRAAALEVLRREMAGIPREEVLSTLAGLRASLAPADHDSEASKLWDALVMAENRQRENVAGSPQGVDPALLRSVLGTEGKDATPATPQVGERLGWVLGRIVDVLVRCDEALRRLNLDLRTHMMLEGRTGGTVVGLKLEEPIRKLIARAVLETGDPAELERRVERIASAGILLHKAHEASNRQAWEAIRKHLDPQVIQKEHGGRAWEAYRKVYHNELLDFGAGFEEQFVTKPFLQEYFSILDKVK